MPIDTLNDTSKSMQHLRRIRAEQREYDRTQQPNAPFERGQTVYIVKRGCSSNTPYTVIKCHVVRGNDGPIWTIDLKPDPEFLHFLGPDDLSTTPPV